MSYSVALTMLIAGVALFPSTTALPDKVLSDEQGISGRERGQNFGASTAATSGKLWRPLHRLYNATGATAQMVGNPEALPPPPRMCRRAAVVTTINAPAAAIEAVADAPGWCLVVVGDAATPDKDFEMLARAKKSVEYLSLTDQRALPFETIGMTPEKSFGRKNIGYLFAAWCGAELIFDFDDDNVPLSPAALDDPEMQVADGVAAIQGQSAATCNPYAWFGAPYSWPRGLPLESINGAKCGLSQTEITGRQLQLGVIQSLANHDPDVDAIYRLGPRAALPLPFLFTPPMPRQLLVLTGGVVAPFNAQATWWRAAAFAGLMLPTTVHGRVSDIWRSYVAQRAMHCAHLKLAFAAPAVEQIRNAHSYLADYMAERPLYEQAGALVRALAAVPCADSLAATVADAYVALYDQGFVEREDVETVGAFLRDLARTRVLPPSQEALPRRPTDSAGRKVRTYGDLGLRPEGVGVGKRSEVALMVMTKDDVQLLSRWLIYHGHLFGYEHLYVFDGSTGEQDAYLKWTAKHFPIHVRHSLVNLNHISGMLVAWMSEINDRYQWIMKVDTDEFVAYAPGGKLDAASTSFHLPAGTAAVNLAVEWQLIVTPVKSGSPTDSEGAVIENATLFKHIYSGPKFNASTFNLGSHCSRKQPTAPAPGLAIVHYHARSYDEMIRVATQVIISLNYINATDNSSEMIRKLTLLAPPSNPRCALHSRRSCGKIKAVLEDLTKGSDKMRSAYDVYSTNSTHRYLQHDTQPAILRDFRNYLREIFVLYPSLLRPGAGWQTLRGGNAKSPQILR